jgi:RNA polymerase sigma-70 factor (ECF subfamily)
MSETALNVTARWSELLTRRRRRSCFIFDYELQTTTEARRRNPQARSHELMDIRANEPEFRALMLKGLEGDGVAHKALLKGLSAYLRAYFKGQLIRIGRGPADAEDLVQETLIAVHNHRHTYDRSQLLTPWVYAIARYKLVDYLRRAKASATDVPIEEAQELLADDDSSAVESGLDLKKLMAQLAPKTRQAIQFVKLDGLSVSEAAERSGMSQSAIKVSVHRGLRALSLLVRQGSPS